MNIQQINANQHFEYKGDVTISGGIGCDATIIVKDGLLTVNGDIGDGVNIRIESKQVFIQSIFCCQKHQNLRINGHVGKNVKINTQGCDIYVSGNIGARTTINTKAGDIQAANVASHATLKTMAGDIQAANVASHATLETMAGDIHVENIASHATLKTMAGDIHAIAAEAGASISTMCGEVHYKQSTTPNALLGTIPVVHVVY